ncbi:hypothetical protein TNCV_330591 [Trichonephila clavipes]|nr:hypothetical protein TNCV_330591 [Trichonephila clavipes]
MVGMSRVRAQCHKRPAVRRLDQVHEPKSLQEIVHQKRTGIDVLPFKSCTKQKMIWSCLYQIAFSTILVNFLAQVKGKASNVSTCKPTNSCLDDSIRLDGKGTTWGLPIIPGPDGHGYELVSSVRALVPQKFSVEEELMHVKHVEVKRPHVGVMWKFGRGVISSGIVLVT